MGRGVTIVVEVGMPPKDKKEAPLLAPLLAPLIAPSLSHLVPWSTALAAITVRGLMI